MNIVVTGINGFVGKHLTRELVAGGHSVVGISMEHEAHTEIADLLQEYASCNLAETWPALNTQPDAIIHLAGLAAVGPSFEKPQQYINLNSAMVTNMCESYTRIDTSPRIVIISSGAIYTPNQPMPLTENSELSYTSPYSISKILVENQAAYYRSRGLDCVVMRPFNHVGPGQLPGFLIPDLLEKITSRSNPDDSISVGNLQTKRDYTDVRDVVKAYAGIATKQGVLAYTTYNVCSGASRSGEEILHTIATCLGIDVPKLDIDQSLIRPNDAPDIFGSATHLAQEIDWKTTYSIEETISDIVAP
ncbi:GDP-mannose 4,6-dehydratase [Candidatus Saccharibacteria bacterium]|nr:GDP-mannose 4,6-dehydratase [Candidatus Saccharibacteria bacterium]